VLSFLVSKPSGTARIQVLLGAQRSPSEANRERSERPETGGRLEPRMEPAEHDDELRVSAEGREHAVCSGRRSHPPSSDLGALKERYGGKYRLRPGRVRTPERAGRSGSWGSSGSIRGCTSWRFSFPSSSGRCEPSNRGRTFDALGPGRGRRGLPAVCRPDRRDLGSWKAGEQGPGRLRSRRTGKGLADGPRRVRVLPSGLRRA
jgi:hypothetical protein